MGEARYFGFNPPFIGGVQGVMSRQEDQRLIKNDLLQLLLTIPGERIHRPKFGTSLRATVFEPFDDATLSELREEILTAIRREEPRVVRPKVYLTTNINAATLNVTVVGFLSFDPNIKLEMEYELSAPGVSSQ